MSYFDKKIEVPSPGPLNIYVHALREAGYENEVPNPMWVSKWLAEIFYMLEEWNEPFLNYELHLWSQLRPDNPLRPEVNQGQVQSGLTSLGKTELNTYNLYIPNDPENIDFQRLLSHEFGHQYWLYQGMYDSSQKAAWHFYQRYLKMRNLNADPANEDEVKRNREIWAEDFKFSCGTYKTLGSFKPTDIPATNNIPGLGYYIRYCHALISWFKQHEQNRCDSLSYYVEQNGSACYWMWYYHSVLRGSRGDGFVYELQNDKWVIISERKRAGDNPLPLPDVSDLEK